ncbi:Cytochrome P450 2S1 [Pteropus alecto]|uniref:Cytochrome P450 2S1 n=1 Tax=Pteropus alecto TaxID=9402 RepID=L5KS03_PTEAL|nr:Cytochrome P450 2S1 [Pteropus alecto]
MKTLGWKRRQLAPQQPPSRSLPQLSKKHGPVFTVHLGPWRRVVVLVGHQAVQEALGGQAEEFSGRGMLATLDPTFDGHGVFFSNGERWRQLRKFTTLALRDLGMGKREGEELIQAEAQCLVEAFQGTKGQPFDPSLLLAQATSNVVCSLTFGLRFSYDDQEFQAVVRAAGGVLLGISSPWGQTYEMFSWLLQRLPGPHTQLLSHVSTLAAFAIKQVQRHQGSLDASGPALDVVDAFMLKMAKVGEERMREELTRELGPGRAPGLQDRARLPYTNAVLHEAQRLLALVPMGIPRALTRTTRFRGYTLPQYKTHTCYVRGKRVCLGEGLARAELFLLITAILQAFFLESPCPPRSLSLQPAVSGLFNIPPAFQLQVRPR